MMGLGSPTRLLALTIMAVLGLLAAKWLAKTINQPKYLFI